MARKGIIRPRILAALFFGITAGMIAVYLFMCPINRNDTIKYDEKIIVSGGDIADPGRYVLKNKVSGYGPNVINILSDGVDLDLNGQTISCQDRLEENSVTFGINVEGKNNIIIRNGSIENCFIGVRAIDINNGIISNINFSEIRYMGVDASGTGLSIRASRFHRISGYEEEAYSIGINFLCDGGACVIERNTFSELYRQPDAAEEMAGEGVGIIVRAGSSTIRIAQNTFFNSAFKTGTIGVWVAESSEADIAENSFVGFERGIVGSGHMNVRRNMLWLDKAVEGSQGIDGNGMAERNLIVGYATPLFGVRDIDNTIHR